MSFTEFSKSSLTRLLGAGWQHPLIPQRQSGRKWPHVLLTSGSESAWGKSARVFEIPASDRPVLLSLSCSLCIVAHTPSMPWYRPPSSTWKESIGECHCQELPRNCDFVYCFNMAHINFQTGYKFHLLLIYCILNAKKDDWHSVLVLCALVCHSF